MQKLVAKKETALSLSLVGKSNFPILRFAGWQQQHQHQHQYHWNFQWNFRRRDPSEHPKVGSACERNE